MEDLPIIPCYDSTNCKNTFNCAPDISFNTNNCQERPTNQLINCPDGQKQLYCFGSNSNYCSGIIQQCDPNDGYKCKTDISNPAQNKFSEYLGCDIATDGTDLSKDQNCLEFQNQDSNICQSDCWDLGGSTEVGEICNSHFKDQDSCNAMKYFCKWKDNKCSNVDDDPWKLFSENSPKSGNGIPKIIFNETIGNHTLHCAQSSWSSTKKTSYADTIRTCCLTENGTDNTVNQPNKKCITTPRCQFVETSCECGFKDIDPKNNPSYNSSSSSSSVANPLFICEDTQQSLIVNDTSITKKGYCTWCKGTQIKEDFDYRKWLIDNNFLIKGHNIRDSIAWGTPDSCKNRCSNYNDCEINDSEKLWNECIWRNSKGLEGIDPDSTNLDLSKGFCYNSECLSNASNSSETDRCNTLESLKNICENELSSNVSTKNQSYPIGVNDRFSIVDRCTEGSKWIHFCSKTNGIVNTQNYACGWCSNLQNDWPSNPCSNNNFPVNEKWYNTMGLTETNAIITVVFIVILSIICLILFTVFCKWVVS